MFFLKDRIKDTGLFKGCLVTYYYNVMADSKHPLVEDPRKYLQDGRFYIVTSVETMNELINIRVRECSIFKRLTPKGRALELPFFDHRHFKVYKQPEDQ